MISKKLKLVKLPPFGYNSYELFTVGEIYEGDLCPVEYDPRTYQIVPKSYVVRCNDGKFRKVGGEYFITLDKGQINKILWKYIARKIRSLKPILKILI